MIFQNQLIITGDYHDIVGDNIPYRKFGFQTFEQFILSIPDVARLERYSFIFSLGCIFTS